MAADQPAVASGRINVAVGKGKRLLRSKLFFSDSQNSRIVINAMPAEVWAEGEKEAFVLTTTDGGIFTKKLYLG